MSAEGPGGCFRYGTYQKCNTAPKCQLPEVNLPCCERPLIFSK